MKMASTRWIVVLLALGLLSLPVYAQTDDAPSPPLGLLGTPVSPLPASPQDATTSTTHSPEIVIFSFCVILLVGWFVHILMVHRKVQDLQQETENEAISYSKFLGSWYNPERWTFLSTVIVLPVGLSLALGIFRVDGVLFLDRIPFLPGLAYQFAISIFLIMITLEIAALHNTSEEQWRSMLTAALTIDLVAFSVFAMMGEPAEKHNSLFGGVLILSFFLLSGIISVMSSFLTLYHARIYDLYIRNLQKIK